MTLFKTATELQIRLKAAQAADAEDQLLSRGRTVRTDLVSAVEYFEAAQSYRAGIGRTDMPLDATAVRRAIGNFRGALSNSGPKAFQQQSAVTLRKVLTAQTKRVDGWVRSAWRANFAADEELLKRAESDDLHGSYAEQAGVQSRASRIRAIQNLDPVRERDIIEQRLNAKGLDACLASVKQLIEALSAVIAAIDEKKAAMTPQVKVALRRAASPDGLPLRQVIHLLVELESSGMLDYLVVRRR